MSSLSSSLGAESVHSRRLSRRLLFCLLAGFCCVASCSKDDEEESAEDKELVPTVLAAIRVPEEGQFPDPESAVRFLLDQVKKRDVNEVARVFPIKEHYQYASLEETGRSLRMYTYRDTPVPGAEYHNLQLALSYLEDIYEQVSIICLGIDPDERLILSEFKLEEDIADLKEKFDYDRLGNLEIKSIELLEEEETAPDMALHRVLGAKKGVLALVEVHCVSVDVALTFRLFEIEGNWLISDLYGFHNLDE